MGDDGNRLSTDSRSLINAFDLGFKITSKVNMNDRSGDCSCCGRAKDGSCDLCSCLK